SAAARCFANSSAEESCADRSAVVSCSCGTSRMRGASAAELAADSSFLAQEAEGSSAADGAISWGSGVCLLSASGCACGASRGYGTRCNGDQCETALGAVIYLAVLANAPGAGGLLHVPCPFKLWRL